MPAAKDKYDEMDTVRDHPEPTAAGKPAQALAEDPFDVQTTARIGGRKKGTSGVRAKVREVSADVLRDAPAAGKRGRALPENRGTSGLRPTVKAKTTEVLNPKFDPAKAAKELLADFRQVPHGATTKIRATKTAQDRLANYSRPEREAVAEFLQGSAMASYAKAKDAAREGYIGLRLYEAKLQILLARALAADGPALEALSPAVTLADYGRWLQEFDLLEKVVALSGCVELAKALGDEHPGHALLDRADKLQHFFTHVLESGRYPDAPAKLARALLVGRKLPAQTADAAIRAVAELAQGRLHEAAVQGSETSQRLAAYRPTLARPLGLAEAEAMLRAAKS